MLGDWFKALWTPHGRSSRLRYWSVVGACLGIMVGFSGVLGPIIERPGDPGLFGLVMGLVGATLLIAILVAVWFNGIKRLHDLGRSGWWLLLITIVIVPFSVLGYAPGGLGALASLIAMLLDLAWLVTLGAWPGQPGPNRFGPPTNQPAEEALS